jgi:iron complex outermembrane receptor protein
MGTAILRHTFSDRLKLSVSGRYYFSKANESGSFIYPRLAAEDAKPPVYSVYPISMVTRTKEATLTSI